MNAFIPPWTFIDVLNELEQVQAQNRLLRGIVVAQILIITAMIGAYLWQG